MLIIGVIVGVIVVTTSGKTHGSTQKSHCQKGFHWHLFYISVTHTFLLFFLYYKS